LGERFGPHSERKKTGGGTERGKRYTMRRRNEKERRGGIVPYNL